MNDDSMNKAIRQAIPVPSHVNVAANMCRYDLMYGPAYARLPNGDVTKITDDDLATLYNDAEDSCEPEDKVVEVYTSEIGDVLREFIDDLPSRLWYDSNADCVETSEPEGFEDEDGEWIEPFWEDYRELETRDIVEALFGRTIAREFN